MPSLSENMWEGVEKGVDDWKVSLHPRLCHISSTCIGGFD